jgi:hypothetical protein
LNEITKVLSHLSYIPMTKRLNRYPFLAKTLHSYYL